MSLLKAIEERRSHYVINDQCNITPNEITSLVEKVLRHTPSMFNMQSTRIIILYGEHHKRLWDLVKDNLGPEILRKRPNVAHEHFPTVEEKINSLRNGFGTILTFEDTLVIEETKDRYPAYTPSFETWSLQSSAMAQYAIWLAFTELSPRIGMSLQHYFPDRVEMNKIWDIPGHWKMTGQMPFGNMVEEPAEKTFTVSKDLVRSFS